MSKALEDLGKDSSFYSQTKHVLNQCIRGKYKIQYRVFDKNDYARYDAHWFLIIRYIAASELFSYERDFLLKLF